MINLLPLIGSIALLIAAIIFTETEAFTGATMMLIISVIGAQVFHLVDFLTYAHTHALTTLLYVVGYLVVGVAWSFVKWLSFLIGFRNKYRAQKESFLKDHPGSPWTDKLSQEFFNYLGYSINYRGNFLRYKPSVTHNKGRIVAWMTFWPCSIIGTLIVAWMTFWPCSIIGTLLNDPVRRLFNWLFISFKALYQRMSDWVFRNEKEMK